MMKVAITGSTGLVGSRIVELLKDSFTFIPLTQDHVDITDHKAVSHVLSKIDFDIFLHLAAYTAVDKAETEKEIAWKINVEGTRNVFEETRKKEKHFVLFSTDFVFDGVNPPFVEDSLPNPLGQYAYTKREAEKIVENEAMLIRISYPYRKNFEPKRDLFQTLLHLIESGKTLTMIEDASITPTFIDDIAVATEHLLKNFNSSIYHIVGSKSVSPLQLALEIADTYALSKKQIMPISFAEYSKGKAPRSQYSIIKSTKNTFHPMKPYDEGLRIITS